MQNIKTLNLKIASWNVNSLKVRLPDVLKWLESEKPDILGLQELKLEDKNFPEKIFQELGYYTACNGQKTYNGTAFISKYQLTDIEKPDPDEQHRMIAASIGSVRVVNVYVPNGESVISEKYEYKLNWLLNLKSYLTEALKKYAQLIILGDFNIAPSEEDVHDPVLWKDKVLFSEPEKEALKEIMSLGLSDSFRLFPQPPKTYSWWDYRMLGFRLNKGMRIDHILMSDALKKHCTGCYIDKTPRGWERPSDHAPIMASFDV